jgi:hypothetical protein
VQAVHAQPKEIRDQGGVAGAGMKPDALMHGTYLSFSGYWFMDTPLESARRDMDLSWALIQPGHTTTLNPNGKGHYLKGEYSGYKFEAMEEIPAGSVPGILATFPGKRPGPWQQ